MHASSTKSAPAFPAKRETFTRTVSRDRGLALLQTKAWYTSGPGDSRSSKADGSGFPLVRGLGASLRLVTPTPVDDAELLRALGKGEAWAARQVWDRHASMVFQLLERTLGPNGEAEDLTQEVFLRTFSSVHRLRDPTALRSFIYSIAVRTLRWELRRRRVRRVLRLSDTGELPEPPVRRVDNDARQALVHFYFVLDRLRVNDRTAFVLRHLEGLKLEEIAERLGVSLATAKRWVARGTKEVSALVARDPELSAHFKGGGSRDEG